MFFLVVLLQNYNMKKYLFAASILITQVMQAQLEKGNWMLGSNIAVTKLEIRSTATDIRLFINPSAQVFISDKVCVGAGLDLDYNFSKRSTDTFSTSSLSWGLGPQMRFYFAKPSKGGAFSQLKVFFGGNNLGTSTLNPELNFGYDFVLNEFLALEIFTGYGAVIPFRKGEQISHKIPFGIGFQIFLR